MPLTVQSVVDALSARLSRPVLVDDRHGRLLAYSSQQGVVDSVRTDTILNRVTPPQVTAWIRSFSLASVDRPFIRIPENSELDLLARVCFPVRAMDTLLGSVWLIEASSRLSDDEIVLVEDAVESIRALLHREMLLDELSRSQERELLRDLLDERDDVRARAAEWAADMGPFRPNDHVTVLVARRTGSATLFSESERLAADTEMDRLHSDEQPSRMAHLVHGDQCTMWVAVRERLPAGGAAATRLGTSMQLRLQRVLGEDVVVGIGGIGPIAESAQLHRRAIQALDVAHVVPSFQPVSSWWQLGIYRLLLKLPANELSHEDLHPGLGRVLADSRGPQLARTLECYLDNGCSAPETAKQLFLARGSLYHRLRRIEEIGLIDLRNGDDRLDVHLSLKVARLRGIELDRAAAY